MKGAIYFASKYGSTAAYAHWISDATGLQAYDIMNSNSDPSDYDFLVLGGPIIYHKLWNRQWIKSNYDKIINKPIIFFSVSGAGAGKKLDQWISQSLPEEMITKMKHVALKGRQNPKELSRFDRMMLLIAGFFNPNKKASKDEMQGFDYMDKAAILPLVNLVKTQMTELV